MSKDNENNGWIVVLFIIWMIMSLILVCSVIGLVLFVPGINNSQVYKPVSDRRSTWATIGHKLLTTLT